uniref:Reverse transcriptase domain-containing protein n=1 Tax=Tanacetum cinerariifolium TaxID=118510 RepID=A0A699ICX9_TANCI|nr:reverse transcriptase domain-containing protein [Tanacetum cinerariifolium]
MTRLLEKDTSFIFSQECVDAFQTLKRKLTEAVILIAPDWDMPFELMCDASDFAIGVVLGQQYMVKDLGMSLNVVDQGGNEATVLPGAPLFLSLVSSMACDDGDGCVTMVSLDGW